MQTSSVTIVNNFAKPYLGGGETQLLMLAKGLCSKGIKLTIICAKNSALSKKASELGAQVEEVDFGATSLLKTLKVIEEAARSSQIVQGTGYYTNIITRLVSKKIDCKIINVHHTMADARNASGNSQIVRDIANRFTLGRVDKHVAVSHAVAESYIDAGISKECIKVIYNGVNAPKASVLPSEKKSGVTTVGFLGRLETVKGPDIFLETAALLAKTNPTLLFLVAGEGSLRDSMQELAIKLEIKNRVVFTGYKPAESVLPQMDVLVVSSRSEALPTAPIEAQMMGVPVVACNVGGMSEVIENEKTGILCTPNSPSELANVTQKILTDQRFCRDIVSQAQLSAQQKFDAATMVENYLSLYNSLLSR